MHALSLTNASCRCCSLEEEQEEASTKAALTVHVQDDAGAAPVDATPQDAELSQARAVVLELNRREEAPSLRESSLDHEDSEDSEDGVAVTVADEVQNISVRRVASFDRLRSRTNALTRAKQANSSRQPLGQSYLGEQSVLDEQSVPSSSRASISSADVSLNVDTLEPLHKDGAYAPTPLEQALQLNEVRNQLGFG
jgi:hypothetical protein